MPVATKMHKLAQPRGTSGFFLESDYTRIWPMKRAVRYAVGGCVIGAVLSVTALILVIAQSRYAHASPTCALLVHIAYWPVLIVGWDARELFASSAVILVNILA